MRVPRLVGLVCLIGWLGMALTAGATTPARSCSSVFVEALQEYRTVCSNGAYYTTRYNPLLRDWEMRQTFPSGPQKPPPLFWQPRPNIRQR
jgi:hypothetical protein